ncbi:MAG: LacI family DNA-binding transcriptional regulator [bacterium]|jgi:LacI family transcriptional regulator|nr:LacI family DNA-binding transcriptional regulator [bacterium]MDD4557765.1 LacI family DNA-binding transcriptional regulator [bacterium]
MASIYDIAKMAGVSAATVSRVINNERYVSPATREKVQKVLRQTGFIPNANASSLTKKRTDTIAVVVPDLTNPFFTEIIRGIEEQAAAQKIAVIVFNTDEDMDKEHGALRFLMEKRVDALIIASAARFAKHITSHINAEMPLVLLDRQPKGLKADLVRSDDHRGAQMLVDYLVGLGHREIGFIKGKDGISTAKLRLEGYLQALEKHGLEPDEKLIVPGDFKQEGGREGMLKLLALASPPSCVITSNNLEAIGALAAIRQRGLSVPEDISLVCFDDLELASQVYPFLTVVAQPVRTMGAVAAQLALERLDGKAQKPREVVMQMTLLERNSVRRV